MALAIPAAYSLARYKYRGRDDIGFYILSTRMMAPAIVAIPIFFLFRNMGLLDTIWALMLVYSAINLSIVTWIIRSYMMDIPKELEDAARTDGASDLRILWEIIIPAVLPGIITAAVIAMIFAINEFLFTLLIASTPVAYTMSVALANFTGGSDGLIYNAIALVAFLAFVPVFLVVIAIQKHLFRERIKIMARIQLSGIQKQWGDVWGVRDVNIDIADEELVVLLGPSGFGKTTTMQMIAGLEDPTEGEIIIDGEVMTEVDARDRDVAMVFQGYALYPNMSIYENIRFPLRMRNVPKGDQDRLVRRAADMVEMGDYLERKPSALSGGQRQLAALARAVVREPQVFLMDEPLSNLDAKLRQAMRVQIKHLQRQLKITTVYVTHDQIKAMTLADRIVILQGGTIQQIGTPDEIYSDPENTFVVGFIGAPPMNLISDHIHKGIFTAENI